MTIKETEVGKTFRYATTFDMSSSTALDLIFTDPLGASSTISDPRVTAPAVEVTDPTLGVLPASTYMEFTTLATDFTTPGTWRVEGKYTDATPKLFYGDVATFTVGDVEAV